MEKEKFKVMPIILTIAIQIAVAMISVALFAVIINLGEIDYKYSPVFGSVAIALGTFASSYYLSNQKGSKGYITGLLVGLIIFAIVTLIGLVIDDGGITINTLFHLIITVLSGAVGGVMGVNRKGKRYI